MFVLFTLGIILAIARWSHHIMWASLGVRGRLVFGAVCFLAGLGSFGWLYYVTDEHPSELAIGIWTGLGALGWFIPEAFRLLGKFLVEVGSRTSKIPFFRLLLIIGVAATVIIAAVNQETIGYLGTIWFLVFAIWLIFTKGIMAGLKPEPKKRKKAKRA